MAPALYHAVTAQRMCMRADRASDIRCARAWRYQRGPQHDAPIQAPPTARWRACYSFGRLGDGGRCRRLIGSGARAPYVTGTSRGSAFAGGSAAAPCRQPVSAGAIRALGSFCTAAYVRAARPRTSIHEIFLHARTEPCVIGTAVHAHHMSHVPQAMSHSVSDPIHVSREQPCAYGVTGSICGPWPCRLRETKSEKAERRARGPLRRGLRLRARAGPGAGPSGSAHRWQWHGARAVAPSARPRETPH